VTPDAVQLAVEQTFPEDGYLTVTVWSDLDDR
jgi:hypothetical protein